MELPGVLGGLFLLGVGAGVLAVAWQGWRDGELPAGSRGFTAYRPSRAGEPAAFHFFLALYVASGGAALVYGALMLAGVVAPLPLR
jgi:hypothetical protein